MPDTSLIRDHLTAIGIALERIKRRFEAIGSPDDFLADDHGLDMLDAIAMMFVAMGEEVKKLDSEIDIDLVVEYPNVDWKGVKGIRDVLSHHYFHIDAETVFEICDSELAEFERAIYELRVRYAS